MNYNEYSEPLDVQSIKNELENVSGDVISILMRGGKAKNSCRELPKQPQKEQPSLSGQRCCYTIADEISESFDIVGIIETLDTTQNPMTNNIIILGRRKDDDI